VRSKGGLCSPVRSEGGLCSPVRSEDSVDKVSGELMEKVSRLMYVIGWRTADQS
jgi:hypothetical protein